MRFRRRPSVPGFKGTPGLALAIAREGIQVKHRLVAARKAAGLDQADVAARMRVDVAAIGRFERSDSNPTLASLMYYAHAVGAGLRFVVEPDWSEQTHTG